MPPYLLSILGVAKLLGGLAIAVGRPARLVDGAYAGDAVRNREE